MNTEVPLLHRRHVLFKTIAIVLIGALLLNEVSFASDEIKSALAIPNRFNSIIHSINPMPGVTGEAFGLNLEERSPTTFLFYLIADALVKETVDSYGYDERDIKNLVEEVVAGKFGEKSLEECGWLNLERKNNSFILPLVNSDRKLRFFNEQSKSNYGNERVIWIIDRRVKIGDKEVIKKVLISVIGEDIKIPAQPVQPITEQRPTQEPATPLPSTQPSSAEKSQPPKDEGLITVDSTGLPTAFRFAARGISRIRGQHGASLLRTVLFTSGIFLTIAAALVYFGDTYMIFEFDTMFVLISQGMLIFLPSAGLLIAAVWVVKFVRNLLKNIRIKRIDRQKEICKRIDNLKKRGNLLSKRAQTLVRLKEDGEIATEVDSRWIVNDLRYTLNRVNRLKARHGKFREKDIVALEEEIKEIEKRLFAAVNPLIGEFEEMLAEICEAKEKTERRIVKREEKAWFGRYLKFIEYNEHTGDASLIISIFKDRENDWNIKRGKIRTTIIKLRELLYEMTALASSGEEAILVIRLFGAEDPLEALGITKEEIVNPFKALKDTGWDKQELTKEGALIKLVTQRFRELRNRTCFNCDSVPKEIYSWVNRNAAKLNSIWREARKKVGDKISSPQKPFRKPRPDRGTVAYLHIAIGFIVSIILILLAAHFWPEVLQGAASQDGAVKMGMVGGTLLFGPIALLLDKVFGFGLGKRADSEDETAPAASSAGDSVPMQSESVSNPTRAEDKKTHGLLYRLSRWARRVSSILIFALASTFIIPFTSSCARVVVPSIKKEIPTESEMHAIEMERIISQWKETYPNVPEDTERMIGLLKGSFRTPENAFDFLSWQREIVKSGKPLEFAPGGLLYHGRDGLDEIILAKCLTKHPSGRSYLTRVPHEWATGDFVNISKSPAIFVVETDIFNRLFNENRAKLKLVVSDSDWIADPWPYITEELPLESIKEIWIDEDTYGRYEKIIKSKDSELSKEDRLLKPELKILFKKAKLKKIPYLSHTILTSDTYGYITELTVGMYMKTRGFFDKIPPFKLKGEPISAKKVVTPHSVLKEALSQIPPDIPMGEAVNYLFECENDMAILWYLKRFFGLFALVDNPVGPAIYASLIETRKEPEELERRAWNILNDKILSSFYKDVGQFEYEGLLQRAFLISEEAYETFKNFIRKDGSQALLRRENMQEAVSTFLAARKTRMAACAFLSALEPEKIEDLAVFDIEGEDDFRFFWYYLTPVYDELRKRGDSEKSAANHLIQWLKNFQRVKERNGLTIEEGQIKDLDWRDWLDEDIAKLELNIDQTMVSLIVESLIADLIGTVLKNAGEDIIEKAPEVESIPEDRTGVGPRIKPWKPFGSDGSSDLIKEDEESSGDTLKAPNEDALTDEERAYIEDLIKESEPVEITDEAKEVLDYVYRIVRREDAPRYKKIQIHKVRHPETERLPGLPRGKDRRSAKDLIFAYVPKDISDTLDIYVTEKFYNDYLTKNEYLFAELIDHEWQENIKGLSHEGAWEHAWMEFYEWLFSNNHFGISEFMRFYVDLLVSEEDIETLRKFKETHKNDKEGNFYKYVKMGLSEIVRKKIKKEQSEKKSKDITTLEDIIKDMRKSAHIYPNHIIWTGYANECLNFILSRFSEMFIIGLRNVYLLLIEGLIETIKIRAEAAVRPTRPIRITQNEIEKVKEIQNRVNGLIAEAKDAGRCQDLPDNIDLVGYLAGVEIQAFIGEGPEEGVEERPLKKEVVLEEEKPAVEVLEPWVAESLEGQQASEQEMRLMEDIERRRTASNIWEQEALLERHEMEKGLREEKTAEEMERGEKRPQTLELKKKAPEDLGSQLSAPEEESRRKINLLKGVFRTLLTIKPDEDRSGDREQMAVCERKALEYFQEINPAVTEALSVRLAQDLTPGDWRNTEILAQNWAVITVLCMLPRVGDDVVEKIRGFIFFKPANRAIYNMFWHDELGCISQFNNIHSKGRETGASEKIETKTGYLIVSHAFPISDIRHPRLLTGVSRAGRPRKKEPREYVEEEPREKTITKPKKSLSLNEQLERTAVVMKVYTALSRVLPEEWLDYALKCVGLIDLILVDEGYDFDGTRKITGTLKEEFDTAKTKREELAIRRKHPERKKIKIGKEERYRIAQIEEEIQRRLEMFEGAEEIITDVEDETKPDGFIRQGEKAWEEFQSKLDEIKKNDITEAYRERIARVAGQDIGCRFYGFESIVKGPDDFVLGYYDATNNELYLATDVIRELEDKGPPTLIDEYLFHEINCRNENHYNLIKTQQSRFQSHYKEGKYEVRDDIKYIPGTDKVFKGLLGQELRKIINGRIHWLKRVYFEFKKRQKERIVRWSFKILERMKNKRVISDGQLNKLKGQLGSSPLKEYIELFFIYILIKFACLPFQIAFGAISLVMLIKMIAAGTLSPTWPIALAVIAICLPGICRIIVTFIFTKKHPDLEFRTMLKVLSGVPTFLGYLVIPIQILLSTTFKVTEDDEKLEEAKGQLMEVYAETGATGIIGPKIFQDIASIPYPRNRKILFIELAEGELGEGAGYFLKAVTNPELNNEVRILRMSMSDIKRDLRNIEREIRRFNPNIVLMPSSYEARTLHRDYIKAIREILQDYANKKRKKVALTGYETIGSLLRHDLICVLDSSKFNRKMAGIERYDSQNQRVDFALATDLAMRANKEALEGLFGVEIGGKGVELFDCERLARNEQTGQWEIQKVRRDEGKRIIIGQNPSREIFDEMSFSDSDSFVGFNPHYDDREISQGGMILHAKEQGAEYYGFDVTEGWRTRFKVDGVYIGEENPKERVPYREGESKTAALELGLDAGSIEFLRAPFYGSEVDQATGCTKWTDRDEELIWRSLEKTYQKSQARKKTGRFFILLPPEDDAHCDHRTTRALVLKALLKLADTAEKEGVELILLSYQSPWGDGYNLIHYFEPEEGEAPDLAKVRNAIVNSELVVGGRGATPPPLKMLGPMVERFKNEMITPMDGERQDKKWIRGIIGVSSLALLFMVCIVFYADLSWFAEISELFSQDGIIKMGMFNIGTLLFGSIFALGWKIMGFGLSDESGGGEIGGERTREDVEKDERAGRIIKDLMEKETPGVSMRMAPLTGNPEIKVPEALLRYLEHIALSIPAQGRITLDELRPIFERYEIPTLIWAMVRLRVLNWKVCLNIARRRDAIMGNFTGKALILISNYALAILARKKGDELRKSKRPENAEEADIRYELAIEVFRRINLNDGMSREQMAKALVGAGHLYNWLGRIEWKASDYIEAISYYRSALDHFIEALEINPDSVWTKVSLASTYNNIGDAERKLERHQSAEIDYREALGYFEPMLEANPDNKIVRDQLCRALNGLGLIRVARGEKKIDRNMFIGAADDFREALVYFERSRKLEPDSEVTLRQIERVRLILETLAEKSSRPPSASSASRAEKSTPDLAGPCAGPSNDIIAQQLLEKGEYIQFSYDDKRDTLTKPFKIKHVENYESGKPEETYRDDEVSIDLNDYFTEEEQQRIKEWLKIHPIRGPDGTIIGYPRFRVATGKTGLHLDEQGITHSNITHAGKRDRAIYIGEYLLASLFDTDNEELVELVLNQDEYQHLIDPNFDCRQDGRAYQRRLETVDRRIRDIDTFISEFGGYSKPAKNREDPRHRYIKAAKSVGALSVVGADRPLVRMVRERLRRHLKVKDDPKPLTEFNRMLRLGRVRIIEPVDFEDGGRPVLVDADRVPFRFCIKEDALYIVRRGVSVGQLAEAVGKYLCKRFNTGPTAKRSRRMMKYAVELLGQCKGELFEHLERGSDGNLRKSVRRIFEFKIGRGELLTFEIPQSATCINIKVFAKDVKNPITMTYPLSSENGSLTQGRYIDVNNLRVVHNSRRLALADFIVVILEELAQNERIDRAVVQRYLDNFRKVVFYRDLRELESRAKIHFDIHNGKPVGLHLETGYYCGLEYRIENGQVRKYFTTDSSRDTEKPGRYRVIPIHTHPLKGSLFADEDIDLSIGDCRILEGDIHDLEVIFARISEQELRGRISALDDEGNVLTQDISLVKRNGKVRFKVHGGIDRNAFQPKAETAPTALSAGDSVPMTSESVSKPISKPKFRKINPEVHPNPKAVVFDLDGTMVTLKGVTERACWPIYYWVSRVTDEDPPSEFTDDYRQFLLDTAGTPFDMDTKETIEKGLRSGHSIEEFRAIAMNLAGRYGIGIEIPDNVNGLVRCFTAIWEKILEEEIKREGRPIRFLPGVKDMLDYLHSSGAKLYIVTGNSENITRRLMEELGVAGYFKGIYGASAEKILQFPNGKSDALELIRKMSGIESDNEILMIGDGRGDMEAAKANGRNYVSLGLTRNDAENENALMQAKPDFLAPDLRNWRAYLKDLGLSKPIPFPGNGMVNPPRPVKASAMRIITIKNDPGIHARPASQICRFATEVSRNLKINLYIEKGTEKIHIKSPYENRNIILKIVSLAIQNNEQVNVYTEYKEGATGDEELLNSVLDLMEKFLQDTNVLEDPTREDLLEPYRKSIRNLGASMSKDTSERLPTAMLRHVPGFSHFYAWLERRFPRYGKWVAACAAAPFAEAVFALPVLAGPLFGQEIAPFATWIGMVLFTLAHTFNMDWLEFWSSSSKEKIRILFDTFFAPLILANLTVISSLIGLPYWNVILNNIVLHGLINYIAIKKGWFYPAMVGKKRSRPAAENAGHPYPLWLREEKRHSIYTIFLRRCVRPGTDGNRDGTFTDLKWKFDEIRAMGFKIALLMPLNDTTTFDPSKEDSPYSVLSPYALDPRHIDVGAIDIGIREDNLINKFIYLLNHPEVKPSDYDIITSKSELREYADVRAMRALRDAHPRYIDFIRHVAPSYYRQPIFTGLSNEHIRETKVYKILFELVLFEQYYVRKQFLEAIEYGHNLGLRIAYDMPAFRSCVGTDSVHHPEMLLHDKFGNLVHPGWGIGGPKEQIWDSLAQYNWPYLESQGYGPIIDIFSYWINEMKCDGLRGDAWHYFYQGDYWDRVAALCRKNNVLFLDEIAGCSNYDSVNGRARGLGNIQLAMPGWHFYYRIDDGEYPTPEKLSAFISAYSRYVSAYIVSSQDTRPIPYRYGPMFDWTENHEVIARSIHTFFAMASSLWTVFQDDERATSWPIQIKLGQPGIWAGGRDEWSRGDIRGFFSRLNEIRERNPFMMNGGNVIWYPVSFDKGSDGVVPGVSYNDSGVIPFGRISEDGKKIVISIVNLTNDRRQGYAHLGLHVLGKDITAPFEMRDSLSGEMIRFVPGENVTEDGRIFYDLAPGQAHVFEIDITASEPAAEESDTLKAPNEDRLSHSEKEHIRQFIKQSSHVAITEDARKFLEGLYYSLGEPGVPLNSGLIEVRKVTHPDVKDLLAFPRWAGATAAKDLIFAYPEFDKETGKLTIYVTGKFYTNLVNDSCLYAEIVDHEWYANSVFSSHSMAWQRCWYFVNNREGISAFMKFYVDLLADENDIATLRRFAEEHSRGNDPDKRFYHYVQKVIEEIESGKRKAGEPANKIRRRAAPRPAPEEAAPEAPTPKVSKLTPKEKRIIETHVAAAWRYNEKKDEELSAYVNKDMSISQRMTVIMERRGIDIDALYLRLQLSLKHHIKLWLKGKTEPSIRFIFEIAHALEVNFYLFRDGESSTLQDRLRLLKDEQIGKRLKEIREFFGISQPLLSKAIGVDNSHICRVEIGERNLTAEMIKNIIELLKIDRSLLTGEEETTVAERGSKDGEQEPASEPAAEETRDERRRTRDESGTTMIEPLIIRPLYERLGRAKYAILAAPIIEAVFIALPKFFEVNPPLAITTLIAALVISFITAIKVIDLNRAPPESKAASATSSAILFSIIALGSMTPLYPALSMLPATLPHDVSYIITAIFMSIFVGLHCFNIDTKNEEYRNLSPLKKIFLWFKTFATPLALFYVTLKASSFVLSPLVVIGVNIAFHIIINAIAVATKEKIIFTAAVGKKRSKPTGPAAAASRSNLPIFIATITIIEAILFIALQHPILSVPLPYPLNFISLKVVLGFVTFMTLGDIFSQTIHLVKKDGFKIKDIPHSIKWKSVATVFFSVTFLFSWFWPMTYILWTNTLPLALIGIADQTIPAVITFFIFFFLRSLVEKEPLSGRVPEIRKAILFAYPYWAIGITAIFLAPAFFPQITFETQNILVGLLQPPSAVIFFYIANKMSDPNKTIKMKRWTAPLLIVTLVHNLVWFPFHISVSALLLGASLYLFALIFGFEKVEKNGSGPKGAAPPPAGPTAASDARTGLPIPGETESVKQDIARQTEKPASEPASAQPTATYEVSPARLGEPPSSGTAMIELLTRIPGIAWLYNALGRMRYALFAAPLIEAVFIALPAVFSIGLTPIIVGIAMAVFTTLHIFNIDWENFNKAPPKDRIKIIFATFFAPLLLSAFTFAWSCQGLPGGEIILNNIVLHFVINYFALATDENFYFVGTIGKRSARKRAHRVSRDQDIRRVEAASKSRIAKKITNIKELLDFIFGKMTKLSLMDIGGGGTSFVLNFAQRHKRITRLLDIDEAYPRTLDGYREGITSEEASAKYKSEFDIVTMNAPDSFDWDSNPILIKMIDHASVILKEKGLILFRPNKREQWEFFHEVGILKIFKYKGFKVLFFKDSPPDYPATELTEGAYLIAAYRTGDAATAPSEPPSGKKPREFHRTPPKKPEIDSMPDWKQVEQDMAKVVATNAAKPQGSVGIVNPLPAQTLKLPKGIRSIKLYIDGKEEKNLQSWIPKITNGSYVFNVLISEGCLEIGIVPNQKREDGFRTTHTEIIRPEAKAGVMRGTVNQDGTIYLIKQLSMGDLLNFTPAIKNKCRDDFIILARFLIMCDVSLAPTLLDDNTKNSLKGCQGFRKLPSTLGELAMRRLSKTPTDVIKGADLYHRAQTPALPEVSAATGTLQAVLAQEEDALAHAARKTPHATTEGKEKDKEGENKGEEGWRKEMPAEILEGPIEDLMAYLADEIRPAVEAKMRLLNLFTLELPKNKVLAESPKAVIMDADGIVDDFRFIDFEETLKEGFFAKNGIFDDGYIVLYGSHDKCGFLEEMIKRANIKINVEIIERNDEFDSMEQDKRIEAVAKEAKRRVRNGSGRNIQFIGFVVNQTNGIVKLQNLCKDPDFGMPIAVLSNERGAHSLRLALLRLFEARYHYVSKSQWLVYIMPIRPWSEEEADRLRDRIERELKEIASKA